MGCAVGHDGLHAAREQQGGCGTAGFEIAPGGLVDIAQAEGGQRGIAIGAAHLGGHGGAARDMAEQRAREVRES